MEIIRINNIKYIIINLLLIIKKLNIMKKIYLFVFLCISTLAYSQSFLLVEDFDYNAGDNLADKGWLVHSGTTNPILVTSPGLTFQGYVGSNVGLAAGVNNTGIDVNKRFTPQTSGSVYASFLVNATATSASGDYFFHFFDPDQSTAFRARTFITAEAGKMKVGLTFNAATGPTNMSTLLNFGETYLFVAKYTINDGASNDQVSLYVFSAGENFSSEPETPSVGPLTGTATDIVPTGIALRQFNADQRITVDGFRVKNTWSDLTTNITPKSNQQSVLFYPNPVTDGYFNLFTSNESVKNIEIFDIAGKKVFENISMNKKVDVSNLSEGVYMLKVTEDNRSAYSKLIIK